MAQIEGMGNGGDSWDTGLFECLADAGICVWGFFCLPCLFGENASIIYSKDNEKLGGFLPCCTWILCVECACVIGGNVRQDLREKYNLIHEPCGDCCVHLCCAPCAICQEARELKKQTTKRS